MKTLRQIKEELEIPAIGQTLSRDLMPQIDSAFLKYLKSKDISYTKEQLNTAVLKSTQSEFDDMKILSLMLNNDTDPIFVSNDNYVLDGHHRWIADHNTDGKTEAYVIDLPILELLRVAKEYESMLKEEVTHKDFGPMMDAFVSFASDKLGIKSLPQINYKNDDEQGEQPSFGGYNPSSNEIVICTKNRHPMDVFRTLAHELVHHKQNEDGRIKDVSKEGSTGSPIEDEANSLAGRLMRWFGKANPDKFALSHIVEEYTSTLSAYSPQGKNSKTRKMEGGYAAARPGPGQDPKKPKTWQVRTIQDYNPDDPTSYVTLAGNRELYGKQVTIPSITYRTPEGKDVTHTNVRGHVHDTGKAFRKTGIERLDVAVGRDMPGNLGDQPFSMKSHTLRKGWDNSTQTPSKESPQPTQAKPNIPTGEPPAGSPQYKDAEHDADLMPKPSKPVQVKSQEPSPQSEPSSTPEQPVKRGITSGAIARAVRNQIQEKRNLNTEESLHKWFQSKSTDGKRGWVQIGGKYQGKPCARQPGQTSTPKCRSSDEASRMTKDEIKYAVAKKRREDKKQPSKTNAAKPTRVATYKKEKNMNEEKDIKGKSSGKKDACYHKVKARYDVWPSAYASGALVKCRKVGADNWGKKSVDEEFEQLDEAKKKGKVKNPDKSVLGKAMIAAQQMAYAKKIASVGKKGEKIKDISARLAMIDPVAEVLKTIAKHGGSTPITHAAPPKPATPAPSAPYSPPKIKGGKAEVTDFGGVGAFERYVKETPPHKIDTEFAKNLIAHEFNQTLINPVWDDEAHARLRKNRNLLRQIGRASKGKHPEGIGTRILKALRLKEENTPSQLEWGTESLARTYAEDTPGQKFPPETYPMHPLFEKKRLKKKEIEEVYDSPQSSNAAGTVGLISNKEGGPENSYFAYSGVPGTFGGFGISGGSAPFMEESEPHSVVDEKFDSTNPVHQWIHARLTKPKGPHTRITPHEAYKNFEEFMDRFAENKEFGGKDVGIHEFIRHMKDYAGISPQKNKQGNLFFNAGVHMPPPLPKSIKQLRESWDAISGGDMSPVGKGTDERRFDEDWQKVNRQDKTDGLSQKAVNAYRRENPGSKLKTAVTEKNPKGKRAKRRLSFCRRMGGMKKRLTSAKTARDPNSRINKALRRWNCEE